MTGEPMSPETQGIYDNYSVKQQILNSAPVIAQQLLLVDEVMRAGVNMRKAAQWAHLYGSGSESKECSAPRALYISRSWCMSCLIDIYTYFRRGRNGTSASKTHSFSSSSTSPSWPTWRGDWSRHATPSKFWHQRKRKEKNRDNIRCIEYIWFFARYVCWREALGKVAIPIASPTFEYISLHFIRLNLPINSPSRDSKAHRPPVLLYITATTKIKKNSNPEPEYWWLLKIDHGPRVEIETFFKEKKQVR